MTMSLKAPPLPEQDVRRLLDSLPALPQARLPTPLLIETVGLPGTGKSTWSRRLARELGAVVLESDAVRSLLVSIPAHSTAENRRVFRALHAVAQSLLAQSISVIIDATSLRERDRRPIGAIAAVTGARLVVLHFTAREPVIEQRLARRTEPGTSDTSTADIDVYRRMAETVQTPAQVDWLIDTSDPAAAESLFWRVVASCRTGAGTTASLTGQGRTGGNP